MSFLRKVDRRANILEFGIGGISSESYCITKRSVTEFEGTPQGGVIARRSEVRKYDRAIRDNIRLLRLYKEGNILLDFSFLYYMKNAEPSVIWMTEGSPVGDCTIFALSDDEIQDIQAFVENTKVPFEEHSVQLAFESFELSYEIQDRALAFLSLMIALEVMFSRGKGELRYTISRNAAVLLGKDKDDSERIFKEVRGLYDKRSKLVHGGSANEISPQDVLRLRHYVREAIKEMQDIGKDPKEIRDILNTSGFGQRPWRDGC